MTGRIQKEANEVGKRAANATDGGEYLGDTSVLGRIADAAGLLRPQKLLHELPRFAKTLGEIVIGTSDVSVNQKDWRFRDPAWQENAIYRRVGQAYTAFCKSAGNLVDYGDDWRQTEREKFAVELLTSALAPTNTLLGNPAALKRTLDTGGKNLLHGARQFVHDMVHNGGMPSQVDLSTFKLGKNMAASPGAVVFRNDILEIIQYQPQTGTVYERPVLIITPQINKYYFLDLTPGRSFIEYIVSQGIQTFVVSWRNPTPEQASWNLDSYVQALIEASDAIRSITDAPTINTIGFCAGGITMSAFLGYLAATNDDRVNSISYAVTLLDFSQPAMIGMLQSDSLLRAAKARSQRAGIISGKDMARLFAWFRPNDLVWNYWVNNYLMGNSPPTFDILAWNADSTNLPGALHGDFLDIFAANSFTIPRHLQVMGHGVDLSDVKCDAYVTGATTDHLTPWQGCYQTTQLLGGKSRFILSNAGHVASLVNPPGNPKSKYFTGPHPGADSEAWKRKARETTGSWWEDWIKWIKDRSGNDRPAPESLGSENHSPLDPAPGLYVRPDRVST